MIFITKDTCNLDIRILDWSNAQQYASPIRRRVFIEEQCVPESMEWDGLDNTAVHALAFDDNHQPQGYARLLASKQLGRMAVLPEFRGKGIGRALLAMLEDEARNRHYDHIFLHAQIHALPFYEKQGYTSQGNPFDEAGIPHMLMIKTLGKTND